ncbi:Fic family protein [Parabacteroides sp. OttesenSCG-928-G07]|nr:Fic family protein [Parabacteroides sp. OttesenSCG-928-G07]
MIENPPKIKTKDIPKAISLLSREDILLLVEKINDKYNYWSEVKYLKIPDDITHDDLWTCVKTSRLLKQSFVWRKYGVTVSITNNMQRLCHEFDMNFGGSWGSKSILPKENREQYLVSSLMEEAISSSQIEGAATTRKIAKELLRKNISPRDKSQQMIFNNYQTIRFIVENKDEPLSSDLLLKIHALMTVKTIENSEDVGRYRINDDVVVENAITHEVVHTPPTFQEIPNFIHELCVFFNEDSSKVFIHPIIKATIVHFMIAYVHPFVDGNGRTARALCYWLTEYLSISRIISKSKNAYEKAYLHTEADGNDAGYFITYHLKVLDLAFKDLQHYIKRKIAERQEASTFLMLGNINEQQASILQLLVDQPKALLTVKEVQNRCMVSHTTAKTYIDGLVQQGFLSEILLNKIKKGYVRSDDFEQKVRKK